MPKARYVFRRDKQNPKGITRAQQPATDATSALSHWSGQADGRSYEEVTEDDLSLTAELSWSDGDRRAGVDLDRMCDRFGVERRSG
jgi:hypothetical protein